MIASGGGRLEEMTARPGWFHEDICFGGEEDEGSEDKEEQDKEELKNHNGDGYEEGITPTL